MEGSTLVSHTTGNADQNTTPDPTQEGSATDPVNPQLTNPDITPQLAVWVVSGRDTERAGFRRKLQKSSWHHGDRSPPSHMTRFLGNGSAGAINGIQILFQALHV